MINSYLKQFIILFLLLSFNKSFALSTEDRLHNVEDESRAMKLFLEIRCLVCKGQVIENSQTQFALNIKKFVREKIALGYSNDQIKQILVEDYGQEILITPSAKSSPWLWILPIIFLSIGIFITYQQNKKIIKS